MADLLKLLADNWTVLWSTMPLLLFIVIAVVGLTWWAAKAFYAQAVSNAKGLQEVAERELAMANRTIKEFEGSQPKDDPTRPRVELIPVIESSAGAQEAFLELNTKGLHFTFDPRKNKFRAFAEAKELERAAVAKWLNARGLIETWTPDKDGEGVTATPSLTAVSTYAAVTKKKP
jgi:hypothetical protein